MLFEVVAGGRLKPTQLSHDGAPVEPLLLFGMQEAGALGAAWATVVVAIAVLAASLFATLRLLSLSGRELVVQIWRTLVAVLAMAGAIVGLGAAWPDGDGLLASAALLACSIATGGATYLTTLWLLWRLVCPKDGPKLHLARLWRSWLTVRALVSSSES